MRIGFFSDSHGNVPALRAVIDALRGVDRIVCLGDIAYGPMPSASLRIVRELGCDIVRGNGEEWLVDPSSLDDEPLLQHPRLAPHREQHRASLAWVRAQLSEEDLAFLAALPRSIDIAVPGGRSLTAFHASPRHVFDFLLPDTPAAEVRRMLAPNTSSVYVGGHTHQQMLRYVDDAMVVNVGSAGRVPAAYPWPAWWAQADQLPRSAAARDYVAAAQYAVVEVTGTSRTVEFHSVAVAAAELRAMLRESHMPNAANYFGALEDFAP